MGLFTLGSRCNRWKNSNHQCRSWGSNQGNLRDRLTLYHVAIKAGLYRMAVQVYHIHITTTYSPSSFRFVRKSQFEQPLKTRPPSLLGHQAHQMGLFTLGAKCNRWKNSYAPTGDRTRSTGLVVLHFLLFTFYIPFIRNCDLGVSVTRFILVTGQQSSEVGQALTKISCW